jgi:hypothetical protein
MSKKVKNLSSPKTRDDGLIQNSFALNNVMINENDLTVYTVQGNIVRLPINTKRQKMIDELEDAVKDVLDGL